MKRPQTSKILLGVFLIITIALSSYIWLLNSQIDKLQEQNNALYNQTAALQNQTAALQSQIFLLQNQTIEDILKNVKIMNISSPSVVTSGQVSASYWYFKLSYLF